MISSSPTTDFPIGSSNLIGLRTHNSGILAHDEVREAASQPPASSIIVDFFNAQPMNINTPFPDLMLRIFVQASKDHDMLGGDVRGKLGAEEVGSVIEKLICEEGGGSASELGQDFAVVGSIATLSELLHESDRVGNFGIKSDQDTSRMHQ